MYYFKKFLKELIVATNINFMIESNNKADFYYSTCDMSKEKTSCTQLNLGENEYVLRVKENEKVCLPILKHYIEKKYVELFCLKEQFIIDIIQGNRICLGQLSSLENLFFNGCSLMIINVEGSKYEALNILKERYNDDQITSIIFKENLIVIGKIKDKKEEAKTIKQLLRSKLCCKCSVSYGHDAFTAENLKVSYEEAKDAMILGKKIRNKYDIYNYSDMFFEKVIFNIDDNIRKQYLNEFKKIFDNLDKEMITTIEEFINCNLNISEAAKNLYIHRNTLLYRLDKLAKDTNYDIRIFKDATVFTIAFLIWKGVNYHED